MVILGTKLIFNNSLAYSCMTWYLLQFRCSVCLRWALFHFLIEISYHMYMHMQDGWMSSIELYLHSMAFIFNLNHSLDFFQWILPSLHDIIFRHAELCWANCLKHSRVWPCIMDWWISSTTREITQYRHCIPVS